MLALIPARGGSKGLPNKNTKLVGGKPLLFWSIERALQSSQISKTIVSSDSEQILDLVKQSYGHNVHLHKRPQELASDESKTIDLLTHIAQNHLNFEHIVILQPTSPMRKSGLIDAIIEDHVDSGNDLTVSGYYSTDYPYGEHKNTPRQKLIPKFFDDGSVYIFSHSTSLLGEWIPQKWAPYINEFPYTIEIDTQAELKLIQSIFFNYYN